MNADPRVVRYAGGQTHSREDTWRRMLAGIGLWSVFGYGPWTVERKADGLYLGQVGFQDFKRDMSPSIEGQPEIGWFFAVHAHGKGYATEAVGAVLAWADEVLAGQELVAIIDPANAASIRVAEKTGFMRTGKANYHGDTVMIYRRVAGLPAAAAPAAASAA